MATIAIYSPKGGVGKTTLAVNLAWSASALSSRKVLVWDLDAQAAASYILSRDPHAHDEAKAVLEKDIDPRKLIIPTGRERLICCRPTGRSAASMHCSTRSTARNGC